MTLETTTLQTNPALIQQHKLSVIVESAINNGNNASSSDRNRVLSATILTYGATLTHLTFNDRSNQSQDIVLGFDHWQDYLAQAELGALNPYFGCIIGRTASRIARATFELEHAPGNNNNKDYGHEILDSVSESFSTPCLSNQSVHDLSVSNGVDCLHGGKIGFDKQHWATIDTSNADQNEDCEKDDNNEPYVTLQLVSPHGQNGYPGRLVTTVKYQLTSQGEMVMEYWARLEEAPHANSNSADNGKCMDLHSTIVSLTNHTYWNLDGVLNLDDNQHQDLIDKKEYPPVIPNYCTLKDHALWLNSSKLVELGEQHPVPTGRILNLLEDSESDAQGYQNKLLNFSTLSTQGTGMKLVPGLDQIPGGYGYDHVYALDSPDSKSQSISDVDIQGYFPSTPHVATLISARSGIRLDLFTSEPAVVLYAAGYLDQRKLPRTKSRYLDLPTSSLTSPNIIIDAKMDKFAGVCLEPIRYPDAIHHPNWRNMTILRRDKVYRQKTIYKFSIDNESI